jgi:hypothetical protein
MEKFKKSFVILVIVFVFGMFLFSASNDCGCSDTYMRYNLVAYKCVKVGGEVIQRTCYYK